MSFIIKCVCNTSCYLCQAAVSVILRDLTNINRYKELAELEKQNDLSSTIQESYSDNDINNWLTTLEKINDNTEESESGNEIINGEKGDMNLSQNDDDFHIIDLINITNMELTNKDIYTDTILGNNIEQLNHEKKEFIKDFETSINDTFENVLRDYNDIFNEKQDITINEDSISDIFNVNKADDSGETIPSTEDTNMKMYETQGEFLERKCSDQQINSYPCNMKECDSTDEQPFELIISNYEKPAISEEKKYNPTLYMLDNKNQLLEASENHLQKDDNESFCDANTDDDNQIEDLKIETVSEFYLKNETNVIDDNSVKEKFNINDELEKDSNCDEDQGYLKIMNTDKDEKTDEILTESQLVSEYTGSVCDWLHDDNQAVGSLNSCDKRINKSYTLVTVNNENEEYNTENESNNREKGDVSKSQTNSVSELYTVEQLCDFEEIIDSSATENTNNQICETQGDSLTINCEESNHQVNYYLGNMKEHHATEEQNSKEIASNHDKPNTFENMKSLNNQSGEAVKEEIDLVVNAKETMEVEMEIGGPSDSPKSDIFQNNTTAYDNDVPNVIEYSKSSDMILKSHLNIFDSSNQVLETSEKYLPEEVIQSFSGSDTDKFENTIVSGDDNICKSNSSEAKCNCNDPNEHACNCYENHICLQVVNIYDDEITDEIVTESQLISVDTGSVSDWLYKVSPAICLLPASDVFDVSQYEIQHINEQELSLSTIYQEQQFKEQYINQWLEKTENFCSNNLLCAGDFDKY